MEARQSARGESVPQRSTYDDRITSGFYFAAAIFLLFVIYDLPFQICSFLPAIPMGLSIFYKVRTLQPNCVTKFRIDNVHDPEYEEALKEVEEFLNGNKELE
jgi:hypothetical protein